MTVKQIFRYLLGTVDLGLWYPISCSFDLVAYTDADYVGCKIDKKSTSEMCQFLGGCLVSWASKKQHSVALSIAEAEYMAVGSCETQVLWIKHLLLDFNVKLDCVPIFCDNTSAINLTKNLVQQHSRIKHIEIQHHFLRDHVGKDFELKFISTESQLADILTKPLSEDWFTMLRTELGLCIV